MTKVQWWSWRRSVLGRFHLPCAPCNCLSSQPIISPTLFFGLTPAPESLATTHDRQDLVNDSIPQKHSWYTHDQTESLKLFKLLVVKAVPALHRWCWTSCRFAISWIIRNWCHWCLKQKMQRLFVLSFQLLPIFVCDHDTQIQDLRETDHPSVLVSIARLIFCGGLAKDHSRLQDTFTTIDCSFSQVHVASEKINIQKLLFKTPSSFHSNWSTDHFISELHHIPGSLCEWVRRWPSTWQVMSQFPSSTHRNPSSQHTLSGHSKARAAWINTFRPIGCIGWHQRGLGGFFESTQLVGSHGFHLKYLQNA